MKRKLFYLCFALISMFAFMAACTPKKNPSDGPNLAPDQASPDVQASVTPSPAKSIAPIASPLPSPSFAEPSPSAAPEYAISDFLPKENAYIKYLLLPEQKQSESSYVEFTQEQRGSRYLVQRRNISGKSSRNVEIFSCDEDSLRQIYQKKSIPYTHNFLGESNMDEILLQSPIAIGTEWEIPSGSRRISSVNVNVDTPLGRISAIEVSSFYEDGSSLVSYYAAGIGLVAEYEKDESKTLVWGREIQERELNKGFTQNIRFFFPDQATQDVKYRTQEIKIEPNIDMRKMFAEKLASVPNKSTLLPLSSSVKINSIKLNKNAVYVDFSNELVTQMDLPRQIERLLFQSLANTFCEYYDAARLYITIDGDQYISRNVMLLEDDYIIPDSSSSQSYR